MDFFVSVITDLFLHYIFDVFHFRHCGLDPQSPQIGVPMGIPGQARDDMSACFETRHIFKKEILWVKPAIVEIEDIYNIVAETLKAALINDYFDESF